MKTPPFLLVLFLGLLAFHTRAQNVSTLVTEGRAFLAAHNVTNAHAKFVAAVAADPGDEKANFFLAATRLPSLVNQSQVSGFLDKLGMKAKGRDVYHWTAGFTKDTKGNVVFLLDPNAAEGVGILRSVVVPQLIAAEANLAKITSTAFRVDLTKEEAGSGPVSLDFADVQLFRAALRGLQFWLYTWNSWNFDSQITSLQNLADGKLSVEQFLKDHAAALSTSSTVDADLAKAAFSTAVGVYTNAVALMDARPTNAVYLVGIDSESGSQADDFRQMLLELRESLDHPVDLTQHPDVTVSMSEWLKPGHAPRDFLPEFRGYEFVLGSFPDTDFGGIAKGVSPSRLQEVFAKVFGALPSLGKVAGPSGRRSIPLHLLPDHLYLLQSSTNLVDWNTVEGLAPVDLDFSTPLEVVPGESQLFYRVLEHSNRFPDILSFPKPRNDDRAHAIELEGFPVVFSGHNINATFEAGEPPLSFGENTSTVWWQWTSTLEGLVDLRDSAGIYPSVSVFDQAGTLVGSNQNLNRSFFAEQGKRYAIRVSGRAFFSPSVGGFKLALTKAPSVLRLLPVQGSRFSPNSVISVSLDVVAGAFPLKSVELIVDISPPFPGQGSSKIYKFSAPPYAVNLGGLEASGTSVSVFTRTEDTLGVNAYGFTYFNISN